MKHWCGPCGTTRERYGSIPAPAPPWGLLFCVLVVLLPVVGGDARPRLLRGQQLPPPALPSAAIRALISSSCPASCYGSSTCDDLDEQYGEDDNKCDYKGLDLALECDCRGCECDEFAPTLAPTLIVERDGSCAVDLDNIGKIFFDEECLAKQCAEKEHSEHIIKIIKGVSDVVTDGLRFESQILLAMSVLSCVCLIQVSGIPNSSTPFGFFMWCLWMTCSVLQWFTIAMAILMTVFAYVALYAQHSKCMRKIEIWGIKTYFFTLVAPVFPLHPVIFSKFAVLSYYFDVFLMGLMVTKAIDGARSQREWIRWYFRWVNLPYVGFAVIYWIVPSFSFIASVLFFIPAAVMVGLVYWRVFKFLRVLYGMVTDDEQPPDCLYETAVTISNYTGCSICLKNFGGAIERCTTNIGLKCKPKIAALDFLQDELKKTLWWTDTALGGILYNPWSSAFEGWKTELQKEHDIMEKLKVISRLLWPSIYSGMQSLATTTKRFLTAYQEHTITFSVQIRNFDSIVNTSLLNEKQGAYEEEKTLFDLAQNYIRGGIRKADPAGKRAGGKSGWNAELVVGNNKIHMPSHIHSKIVSEYIDNGLENPIDMETQEVRMIYGEPVDGDPYFWKDFEIIKNEEDDNVQEVHTREESLWKLQKLFDLHAKKYGAFFLADVERELSADLYHSLRAKLKVPCSWNLYKHWLLSEEDLSVQKDDLSLLSMSLSVDMEVPLKRSQINAALENTDKVLFDNGQQIRAKIGKRDGKRTNEDFEPCKVTNEDAVVTGANEITRDADGKEENYGPHFEFERKDGGILHKFKLAKTWTKEDKKDYEITKDVALVRSIMLKDTPVLKGYSSKGWDSTRAFRISPSRGRSDYMVRCWEGFEIAVPRRSIWTGRVSAVRRILRLSKEDRNVLFLEKPDSRKLDRRIQISSIVKVYHGIRTPMLAALYRGELITSDEEDLEQRCVSIIYKDDDVGKTAAILDLVFDPGPPVELGRGTSLSDASTGRESSQSIGGDLEETRRTSIWGRPFGSGYSMNAAAARLKEREKAKAKEAAKRKQRRRREEQETMKDMMRKRVSYLLTHSVDWKVAVAFTYWKRSVVNVKAGLEKQPADTKMTKEQRFAAEFAGYNEQNAAKLEGKFIDIVGVGPPNSSTRCKVKKFNKKMKGWSSTFTVQRMDTKGSSKGQSVGNTSSPSKSMLSFSGASRTDNNEMEIGLRREKFDSKAACRYKFSEGKIFRLSSDQMIRDQLDELNKVPEYSSREDDTFYAVELMVELAKICASSERGERRWDEDKGLRKNEIDILRNQMRTVIPKIASCVDVLVKKFAEKLREFTEVDLVVVTSSPTEDPKVTAEELDFQGTRTLMKQKLEEAAIKLNGDEIDEITDKKKEMDYQKAGAFVIQKYNERKNWATKFTIKDDGTFETISDDGGSERKVAKGLIRSAGGSSSSSTSTKLFEADQKIEAKFSDEDNYYSGTIKEAKGNSIYEIEYDYRFDAKESAALIQHQLEVKMLENPREAGIEDLTEMDEAILQAARRILKFHPLDVESLERFTAEWRVKIMMALTHVGASPTAAEMDKAGFSKAEIMRSTGDTLEMMMQHGVSAEDALKAGFLAKEMRMAKYALKDLKELLSVRKLKNAGFSATEMREAGCILEDMREPFSIRSLKEAGFSLKDMRRAGLEVEKLKEEHYSESQVREAGVEAATEMRKEGFKFQQLTELFSGDELTVAGFEATEESKTDNPLMDEEECGGAEEKKSNDDAPRKSLVHLVDVVDVLLGYLDENDGCSFRSKKQNLQTRLVSGRRYNWQLDCNSLGFLGSEVRGKQDTGLLRTAEELDGPWQYLARILTLTWPAATYRFRLKPKEKNIGRRLQEFFQGVAKDVSSTIEHREFEKQSFWLSVIFGRSMAEPERPPCPRREVLGTAKRLSEQYYNNKGLRAILRMERNKKREELPPETGWLSTARNCCFRLCGNEVEDKIVYEYKDHEKFDSTILRIAKAAFENPEKTSTGLPMKNPGDDLGCFIGPVETNIDVDDERSTAVKNKEASNAVADEAEFLTALRDLRRDEDLSGWPTWVKGGTQTSGGAWPRGWVKFSPKFDFSSDACITALPNKEESVPAFRISVSRNINGFELPGHMTSIQRTEFEEFMMRVFDKMIGVEDDKSARQCVYSCTPTSSWSDESKKWMWRKGTGEKGASQSSHGCPAWFKGGLSADASSREERALFKDLFDSRLHDYQDLPDQSVLASAHLSSEWPLGRGCYEIEDRLDNQVRIYYGEVDQIRISVLSTTTDLQDTCGRVQKVLNGLTAAIWATEQDYVMEKRANSNAPQKRGRMDRWKGETNGDERTSTPGDSKSANGDIKVGQLVEVEIFQPTNVSASEKRGVEIDGGGLANVTRIVPATTDGEGYYIVQYLFERSMYDRYEDCVTNLYVDSSKNMKESKVKDGRRLKQYEPFRTENTESVSGYLTSSPTIQGTGLRASIHLDLPNLLHDQKQPKPRFKFDESEFKLFFKELTTFSRGERVEVEIRNDIYKGDIVKLPEDNEGKFDIKYDDLVSKLPDDTDEYHEQDDDKEIEAREAALDLKNKRNDETRSEGVAIIRREGPGFEFVETLGREVMKVLPNDTEIEEGMQRDKTLNEALDEGKRDKIVSSFIKMMGLSMRSQRKEKGYENRVVIELNFDHVQGNEGLMLRSLLFAAEVLIQQEEKLRLYLQRPKTMRLEFEKQPPQDEDAREKYKITINNWDPLPDPQLASDDRHMRANKEEEKRAEFERTDECYRDKEYSYERNRENLLRRILSDLNEAVDQNDASKKTRLWDTSERNLAEAIIEKAKNKKEELGTNLLDLPMSTTATVKCRITGLPNLQSAKALATYLGEITQLKGRENKSDVMQVGDEVEVLCVEVEGKDKKKWRTGTVLKDLDAYGQYKIDYDDLRRDLQKVTTYGVSRTNEKSYILATETLNIRAKERGQWRKLLKVGDRVELFYKKKWIAGEIVKSTQKKADSDAPNLRRYDIMYDDLKAELLAGGKRHKNALKLKEERDKIAHPENIRRECSVFHIVDTKITPSVVDASMLKDNIFFIQRPEPLAKPKRDEDAEGNENAAKTADHAVKLWNKLEKVTLTSEDKEFKKKMHRLVQKELLKSQKGLVQKMQKSARLDLEGLKMTLKREQENLHVGGGGGAGGGGGGGGGGGDEDTEELMKDISKYLDFIDSTSKSAEAAIYGARDSIRGSVVYDESVSASGLFGEGGALRATELFGAAVSRQTERRYSNKWEVVRANVGKPYLQKGSSQSASRKMRKSPSSLSDQTIAEEDGDEEKGWGAPCESITDEDAFFEIVVNGGGPGNPETDEGTNGIEPSLTSSASIKNTAPGINDDLGSGVESSQLSLDLFKPKELKTEMTKDRTMNSTILIGQNLAIVFVLSPFIIFGTIAMLQILSGQGVVSVLRVLYGHCFAVFNFRVPSFKIPDFAWFDLNFDFDFDIYLTIPDMYLYLPDYTFRPPTDFLKASAVFTGLNLVIAVTKIIISVISVFMKYLLIFRVEGLVEIGGLAQKELQASRGDDVKTMKERSPDLQVEDFIKMNTSDYSIENLLDGGFSVEDIVKDANDHYTVKLRKKDSTLLQEFILLKRSLSELKKANFKAVDIMKVRDNLDKNIEFKRTGLVKFSAKDFKVANYSAVELRRANMSAKELKDAAYPVLEMFEAEYSFKELWEAGFDAKELREKLSATAKDLINFYKIDALKRGGFTAKELKLAKATASKLKRAGYSASDLIRCDFTVEEVAAAKNADGQGYTLDQIAQACAEPDSTEGKQESSQLLKNVLEVARKLSLTEAKELQAEVNTWCVAFEEREQRKPLEADKLPIQEKIDTLSRYRTKSEATQRATAHEPPVQQTTRETGVSTTSLTPKLMKELLETNCFSFNFLKECDVSPRDLLNLGTLKKWYGPDPKNNKKRTEYREVQFDHLLSQFSVVELKRYDVKAKDLFGKKKAMFDGYGDLSLFGTGEKVDLDDLMRAGYKPVDLKEVDKAFDLKKNPKGKVATIVDMWLPRIGANEEQARRELFDAFKAHELLEDGRTLNVERLKTHDDGKYAEGALRDLKSAFDEAIEADPQSKKTSIFGPANLYFSTGNDGTIKTFQDEGFEGKVFSIADIKRAGFTLHDFAEMVEPRKFTCAELRGDLDDPATAHLTEQPGGFTCKELYRYGYQNTSSGKVTRSTETAELAELKWSHLADHAAFERRKKQIIQNFEHKERERAFTSTELKDAFKDEDENSSATLFKNAGVPTRVLKEDFKFDAGALKQAGVSIIELKSIGCNVQELIIAYKSEVEIFTQKAAEATFEELYAWRDILKIELADCANPRHYPNINDINIASILVGMTKMAKELRMKKTNDLREKAFRAFDEDDNKVITAKEFHQIMTDLKHEDIEAKLKTADANDDGTISREDFIKLVMPDDVMALSLKEVVQMSLDKNMITLEELKNAGASCQDLARALIDGGGNGDGGNSDDNGEGAEVESYSKREALIKLRIQNHEGQPLFKIKELQGTREFTLKDMFEADVLVEDLMNPLLGWKWGSKTRPFDQCEELARVGYSLIALKEQARYFSPEIIVGVSLKIQHSSDPLSGWTTYNLRTDADISVKLLKENLVSCSNVMESYKEEIASDQLFQKTAYSCPLEQLIKGGYTLHEIKNSPIIGRGEKELKVTCKDLFKLDQKLEVFKFSDLEVEFSAVEMIEAGWKYDQLIKGKKTPSADALLRELVRLLGDDGPSAYELLYKAGTPAEELKGLHINLPDIQKAGWPGSELSKAGFSVEELKDAGFDVELLKPAHERVKDYASEGGDWSAVAPRFREMNDDIITVITDLRRHRTKEELKRFGFRGKEMVDANFKIFELVGEGLWASDTEGGFRDLIEEGVDKKDICTSLVNDIQWTARKLLWDHSDTFSLEDVKDCQFKAGDYRGTVSSQLLKEKLNLSLAQMHDGGFTARELKDTFSLNEFYESGLFKGAELYRDTQGELYTEMELKTVGYTQDEIISAEVLERQRVEDIGKALLQFAENRAGNNTNIIIHLGKNKWSIKECYDFLYSKNEVCESARAKVLGKQQTQVTMKTAGFDFYSIMRDAKDLVRSAESLQEMGFRFADIWKEVEAQKDLHDYFKPKTVLKSVWKTDDTCKTMCARDELTMKKWAEVKEFMPENGDNVPELLKLLQKAGFTVTDILSNTKNDGVTIQALKDAGFSSYDLFIASGPLATRAKHSPLLSFYNKENLKYKIPKKDLSFDHDDLTNVLLRGKDATYKALRVRDFTFDEVEASHLDAMARKRNPSNLTISEIDSEYLRLLYTEAGFHEVQNYIGKGNRLTVRKYYPRLIAERYRGVTLPEGALKKWFKNVENCRTPMHAHGKYIDTEFTPFSLEQLKVGGFDATDIVKYATDMDGNPFKNGRLFDGKKMKSKLQAVGFTDFEIIMALKEQEQEKEEQKKGPSEFKVMPDHEVLFDLKYQVSLDGWQRSIGNRKVMENKYYNLGIEPCAHPKHGQLMIKGWYEVAKRQGGGKKVIGAKASQFLVNLNVPKDAKKSQKETMALKNSFPDVKTDMIEYYAIASVRGYEPAIASYQYDLVTSIDEFTDALERKLHPEQRKADKIEIVIKKIKKISRAKAAARKVFTHAMLGWEINTIFTYEVTPDGTTKWINTTLGFGGEEVLVNEWYNLGIQPAVHESTKHVMIKDWFEVETPGFLGGGKKGPDKKNSQFNVPKVILTPSGEASSSSGLPDVLKGYSPDHYFAIDSIAGNRVITEQDLKASLKRCKNKNPVFVVVLLMKKKK